MKMEHFDETLDFASDDSRYPPQMSKIERRLNILALMHYMLWLDQ